MLRRAGHVARVLTAAVVPRRRQPLPRRLRRAFAELGPTYVKLGQVIASSPGFFPVAWAEEFAALRDQVPAFPAPQARAIVEEELGRPLDAIFRQFDDEPLAA